MASRFLNKSLVLVAFLILTSLSACGNQQEDQEKGKSPEAKVPAGTVVGANKGDLAPDFNLKNIAGGQLELSSLRGKAVIIDFWDTWCPPCRKALPHLEAISESYADDLVVVGVAFGRYGESKVQEFVAQNHLTFPMVLADQEFKVAKDFGGVQSIPTTFLLDRNGVILEKWVGGHSREEYEAAVKKAIGS